MSPASRAPLIYNGRGFPRLAKLVLGLSKTVPMNRDSTSFFAPTVFLVKAAPKQGGSLSRTLIAQGTTKFLFLTDYGLHEV